MTVRRLKRLLDDRPWLKDWVRALPGVEQMAQRRLRRAPGLVAAADIVASAPLEEHLARADAYFARLENWEYHLAKPFVSPEETPELLILFATALAGLRLAPGHTVLDFGAGSCWTSRLLTQLGCRVIAVDASPAALRIGRELFARHPVIGLRPEPSFAVFDGRRLPAPDAGVDRILCFDALHHLPNPAEVLREMARVLREGGIAVFSEPGPLHSLSPQSQHEMRNYGVIESDVDLRAIWAAARAAGFTDVRVAVVPLAPAVLSLEGFERYLRGRGGRGPLEPSTRNAMRSRRIFFLAKGPADRPDSRARRGLRAELTVTLGQPAADGIPLQASVANVGEATWLPSGAATGAVNIGVHRYAAADRRLLDFDFARLPLLPPPGRPIPPGERLSVAGLLPSPPGGASLLEFDLVAEGVAWFALEGSPTVTVRVDKP